MTGCYQPLGAVEISTAGPADLGRIADLARRTWWHCYPAIISREQIEYMLAQRYTPEAMASAVQSGRLVFEQLKVDGELGAFAAYSESDKPEELKLQQLYVSPEWQGRGLGGQLIRHVARIARAAGRSHLVLTVNRRNGRAIETYLRSGFTIRETADFDIGRGYLMEDYVMSLPLDSPNPKGP